MLIKDARSVDLDSAGYLSCSCCHLHGPHQLHAQKVSNPASFILQVENFKCSNLHTLSTTELFIKNTDVCLRVQFYISAWGFKERQEVSMFGVFDSHFFVLYHMKGS